MISGTSLFYGVDQDTGHYFASVQQAILTLPTLNPKFTTSKILLFVLQLQVTDGEGGELCKKTR